MYAHNTGQLDKEGSMAPQQENPLEHMLRLTAEDGARYYKRCLATLLDSHVFIILSPFIRHDLSNILNKRGRMRINRWKTKEGTNVVPFFSSFLLLKSIVPQSKTLRIPAPDFFYHNQGRGLSLNPGHPHGLNFNHLDTERLLRFDFGGYLAKVAAEEYKNRKAENASHMARNAQVLDFPTLRSKKPD